MYTYKKGIETELPYNGGDYANINNRIIYINSKMGG